MATKLADMLKPSEPTKAELYAEAQRLSITGRSKMNKGALKAAVKRRQQKLPLTQPRV
jgi:hypothetical protein